MDGKEIAPKDIYQAMNTDDRDTYDREVTSLRTAGLLVEIRTNAAATRQAKLQRKPKAQIPRFRVTNPSISLSQSSLSIPENHRKLYVGNVSQETLQEDFHALFGHYGEIERIDMPIDKQTNQPKGFAFIVFRALESAQNARRDLNGKELKGRRLNVQEYQEKA